MINPFDTPHATFVVLAAEPVGEHGLHCLWPATLDVPSGWSVVYGPASRDLSLDRVALLGSRR